MSHATPAASHLSHGEQRALAAFLAGRLPAGQLHGELCRHREAALAQAAARELGAPVPRELGAPSPRELGEPTPAELPLAVPALHPA